MKKALITGITGQDGSYLAEFLLEKGYTVYGIIRRSSNFNTERIDHLHSDPNLKERFHLIFGDLNDSNSIISALKKTEPDEIYNLGAQSHVRVSFDVPEYTGDVVALGPLRILDAMRILGMEKKVKFYQASSSEIYGKVKETPQNEDTPFYPRSPYGCSKVFGYWIAKNYKESYGMFACNGILFNHESPRRGKTFVTRKITQAVVRIKEGIQDCLYLGNLDAKRDWGHAKDYVEAMWLMLQRETPEDFVIATGETHSVREFLEIAFKHVGIEVKSNGKSGSEEAYIRVDTGQEVVRIDERFFRPTEVDLLLGDPTKAKQELGWESKTTFKELVKEMIEADTKELQIELHGTNGPQNTKREEE